MNARRAALLTLLLLSTFLHAAAQSDSDFRWIEQVRRASAVARAGDCSSIAALSASFPAELKQLGEVECARLMSMNHDDSGAIEKLTALLAQDLSPTVEWYASHLRARINSYRGEAEVGIQGFEHSLALAEENNRCPECRLYARLAPGTFTRRSIGGRPALELALEARNAAERHPNAFLKHDLFEQSIALKSGTTAGERMSVLDEGLPEYFASEGLTKFFAKAAFNLASDYISHHEFDPGVAWLDQAESANASLGYPVCDVEGLRGKMLKMKGDFAGARTLLTASEQCMLDLGGYDLAAWSAYHLGVMDYEQRTDGSDAGASHFRRAMAHAKRCREDVVFMESADYMIYIMSEPNDDSVSHYVDAMLDYRNQNIATLTHSMDSLFNLANMDLYRLRHENDELEKARLAANTARNRIGLIASIVLLILVGAVARLVLKRQKDKHAEEIQRKEQQEALREAETEQLINKHKYERLRAEIQGEEHERDRIAQELHDGLGGSLEMLIRRLEKGMLLPEEIQNVRQQLAQIQTSMRAISHELHLPDFKENALRDLVAALCANIRSSVHLEARVNCYPPNTPLDLTEDLEIGAYRIIQELTTNVIRHAEASELEINITRRPDALSIVVEDNGKGFDPQKASTGIGLSNVRNRMEAMGGTVEIDSRSGRGSIITCEFPLST